MDFLIYGLNDLDIMVCYVGNAYLNSPCQDNIWFAEGPEHVLEKTGKVMVMVRDLYWLKSSGAVWRTMFEETLRNTNFVPTVADPDVYRIQARKTNGEDYYELLLLYVDDVLCCLKNSQLIMDKLNLTYDLKKRLVGPLNIYLGIVINKYQVGSGKYYWRMSSTQCI